jgi:hypothetical protein
MYSLAMLVNTTQFHHNSTCLVTLAPVGVDLRSTCGAPSYFTLFSFEHGSCCIDSSVRVILLSNTQPRFEQRRKELPKSPVFLVYRQ